MSTVLDRLEELRAGELILDNCPRCDTNQQWWVPGNPGPIGVDPEHDSDGLTCWSGCDYEVTLGPPEKSLEEQVRGRRHTDRWQAPCPGCGLEQGWWDTSTGRICRDNRCGYRLGTPVPAPSPPIIMCSHCGGPLEPGEAGYSCEPCGRTVTTHGLKARKVNPR